MVVLFCSLAVLDPRNGHTMDVLCPFIPVLCHSDWLFHGESCPRLDVVHPGRAWSSQLACTWHCSLHYLFLQWECSHWKSANWIELTCVKLTQFHDALLVDVLTKSISAHWSSVQFVCCEHGLKSLSSASFPGCQHEPVAERRAAAPLLLGARRPLLWIDISCLQGPQLQTRRTPLLRSTDGTDRRTDGHPTVT